MKILFLIDDRGCDIVRIISGINKGKKLYGPEGMSVRPTSDKIKEALFNIIGYIDEEMIVLDLFAGSGNVGIEFLARGAKLCYFVDASRKSLSYVKKNLEICNFNDKAKIIQSDYSKAIVNLANMNIKFNYIFADPPYDLNCSGKIADLVLRNNLLAENGLLIIESDKSENVIDNIDIKVLEYKEKVYGRTRISLIKLLED